MSMTKREWYKEWLTTLDDNGLANEDYTLRNEAFTLPLTDDEVAERITDCESERISRRAS